MHLLDFQFSTLQDALHTLACLWCKFDGIRLIVSCADEYSICGWVKNCPDGDVEIQAIGSSSQINGFIQKVSAGSWFSEVEEVEEIASNEKECDDT